MMHLALSEKILLASGIGILASVPLVAFWDIFGIWFFAKVLYGLGLLLVWFNR